MASCSPASTAAGDSRMSGAFTHDEVNLLVSPWADKKYNSYWRNHTERNRSGMICKYMHERNSSFNRSGEEYKQKVAILQKEFRSLKDSANRSREGGIRGRIPWYDLFHEVMGRCPSVQPVSIEDTSESPQSSSNQQESKALQQSPAIESGSSGSHSSNSQVNQRASSRRRSLVIKEGRSSRCPSKKATTGKKDDNNYLSVLSRQVVIMTSQICDFIKQQDEQSLKQLQREEWQNGKKNYYLLWYR